MASTLVGVIFSLIASSTRSIWNSAIVHAFWNIVIIGGIVWTGAEFGIESSIVAVVGYTVVCVIAWLGNPKCNIKE